MTDRPGWDFWTRLREARLKRWKRGFAAWKAIRSRIEELEQGEQDRLRLVDLWIFQKREIEEGRLQSGEDERLETEKRVLANAEKIYNAAMNAFDLLYEGNGSTASSLRAAQKQVEELVRYEPKFQEALAALETARISVEDVGASVRDYAGGIHASPEHLAQVEDRLALLDRLKRKYGPTLDEVIHFGEDVSRKLSEIENKDEILRELRGELAKAAAEYLRVARALSKKRADAARRLEKLVEAEINDLAMKSAFRIEMTSSEEEGNWTASGIDQVVYMISTNPGEPLRQLEHIASGGELSRVMLALKASVEAADPGVRRKRDGVDGKDAISRKGREKGGTQRTLVFDEIDTGIGGRAAEAVGKKLKSLSRSNQVLCVTHLPQIATFGDHHYVIEKKESGGRTRTSIRVGNGRGAHRRSCTHAERSEVDRDVTQTCGADDQGECVRAYLCFLQSSTIMCVYKVQYARSRFPCPFHCLRTQKLTRLQ